MHSLNALLDHETEARRRSGRLGSRHLEAAAQREYFGMLCHCARARSSYNHSA